MKAIANSGNCEDEARMRRVWFNFTAQLADIDMQVMRFSTIASSPHLLEQHMALHNFTFILNKCFEQIIFSWCQLDFLIIYLHEALGIINS